MTDAGSPLPASARMGDHDWPGVVCDLGSGWRLSVSSDGRRYVVQKLGQTDAGPRWFSAGGRQPATLGKLVAKFAGTVEGLAEACEALPDDPAAFAPQFVASVHAKDAAFAARDMRRDAYPRVLAVQSNMRLSVSPDGASYVLQLVNARDMDASDGHWRSAHHAPTLSEMRDFVSRLIWHCVGPGSDWVERGPAVLPHWDALSAGLPERADAGVWPDIPPYPGR
jgi:hypothetical protein